MTGGDNDIRVWFVTEPVLLSMLRAVADGEDPDAVYLEAFANCTQTPLGGYDQ